MQHDKSTDADAGSLIDLDMDAFDPHTVEAYRRRFSSLRPSSPWVDDSDEDFLFHVNALGPGNDGRLHPTRAGLLAFGQEHWIHTVFANYLLDFQNKLDSRMRWADRLQSGSGDWSGNLIDFYYETTSRIDRALSQPFGLVDNGWGHTARTVVNDAIHEAVANALIHAYYGFGAESQVRVFLEPDQLVVSNTGTFLVDRDVALAGGVTQARNPTLMKIFLLIGLVDRAGSGLETIYKTWAEYFERHPDLAETHRPDEVRIALPFASYAQSPHRRRRVSGNEIIALCREREEIRAEDLVEAFGMQRAAAQMALRRSADAGKLVVEHIGRSAVYRLAPTLF